MVQWTYSSKRGECLSFYCYDYRVSSIRIMVNVKSRVRFRFSDRVGIVSSFPVVVVVVVVVVVLPCRRKVPSQR